MSNLEEYRYARLPTGKYTRVIRLLPSMRFKNPIQITLDVVSLEPTPKYEALSYAWEGQTPDQAIDCGGQRLLVTQTCFNALRRLRRKLRPRTLWIDGICIDQHSTEEKNHQVALMGPIYSSAQQVVIWLGEGHAGVDLLFKLLRLFPLLGILGMFFRGQHEAEIEIAAYTIYRISGRGLHLSTLSESVPWFSRLWTVQEADLARKAVYMHGKGHADYLMISKSLEILFIMANPVEDPLLPSHSREKELFKFRTNHLYGDWDMTWDHRLDLVRRTALGKAALPHDKIYAIRAILQRDLVEDSFPLPDYDSDFREIYWKTCVILMSRSDRGLELIQDVGSSGNPSGIPSWVADFNRPAQGFSSLPKKYPSFDSNPETLTSKFSLLDDHTKIATKAHLSTSVTGILDHFGLDKSFRTLETDEERICAALSAAECAWLWIKAGDTLSPNSTLDRTRRLMFRDDYFDRRVRYIPMALLELIRKADESTFDLARFKEHRKAQCQANSKNSKTTTSLVRTTPSGTEINLPALLSWNKGSDGVNWEPDDMLWDAFRRFWDSCTGSSLFWTEDNGIGISLPARRTGDVVALIPGLQWPMLLRRSANGNFTVVSPAYFRWEDDCGVCEEDKLQDIVLE